MAIISPAYKEKFGHGSKLAALKIVRPPTAHNPLVTPDPPVEAEQVDILAGSPFPQLDALWHYECVVSPRSPVARLQSNPASPRSPAARAADQDSSEQPFRMVAPSLLSALIGPHRTSTGPLSLRSHTAAPPTGCITAASPSSLSRFAPPQQALAKRVFSTFDENGDGSVSMEDIGRMFEKLGLSGSDQDLDSLTSLLADIPSLVTKTEGHVDEEEFVLLYEMACCFLQTQDGGSAADNASASPGSLKEGTNEAEQDLLAVFHVFDKDGNGYISAEELQSVLCSLGFSQARRLEACENMIARVDENGDGHVDFFEFKKLFQVDNPFVAAIETF